MSILQRSLALLERLSVDVRGVPMATLADELDMPRSAAHRLLTDLGEHGYVRQSRERGDYVLTTKLVSLGLSFLSPISVIAESIDHRAFPPLYKIGCMLLMLVGFFFVNLASIRPAWDRVLFGKTLKNQ